MTSPVLAAMPLARNAVTFSFCHGSRSARTAMAILVSKRTVIWPQCGPAARPGLERWCAIRWGHVRRGLGHVLARGRRAGRGDARAFHLARVPPAQPRELLVRH